MQVVRRGQQHKVCVIRSGRCVDYASHVRGCSVLLLQDLPSTPVPLCRRVLEQVARPGRASEVVLRPRRFSPTRVSRRGCPGGRKRPWCAHVLLVVNFVRPATSRMAAETCDEQGDELGRRGGLCWPARSASHYTVHSHMRSTRNNCLGLGFLHSVHVSCSSGHGRKTTKRHLGCMRSIFATVLNRGLGPFAQDLNAAEHRPTSTRPIRSGFGPNGYSCAVTFACGFCGDGPCEQSTGLPQTQTRSSLALQWQWSRAAGQLAALDGAGEVLGLPPRGHEQGGPSPPRWIGL